MTSDCFQRTSNRPLCNRSSCCTFLCYMQGAWHSPDFKRHSITFPPYDQVCIWFVSHNQREDVSYFSWHHWLFMVQWLKDVMDDPILNCPMSYTDFKPLTLEYILSFERIVRTCCLWMAMTRMHSIQFHFYCRASYPNENCILVTV